MPYYFKIQTSQCQCVDDSELGLLRLYKHLCTKDAESAVKARVSLLQSLDRTEDAMNIKTAALSISLRYISE